MAGQGGAARGPQPAAQTAVDALAGGVVDPAQDTEVQDPSFPVRCLPAVISIASERIRGSFSCCRTSVRFACTSSRKVRATAIARCRSTLTAAEECYHSNVVSPVRQRCFRAAIPVRAQRVTVLSSYDERCIITTIVFRCPGEAYSRLPCQHAFHTDCLAPLAQGDHHLSFHLSPPRRPTRSFPAADTVATPFHA